MNKNSTLDENHADASDPDTDTELNPKGIVLEEYFSGFDTFILEQISKLAMAPDNRVEMAVFEKLLMS